MGNINKKKEKIETKTNENYTLGNNNFKNNFTFIGGVLLTKYRHDCV